MKHFARSVFLCATALELILTFCLCQAATPAFAQNIVYPSTPSPLDYDPISSSGVQDTLYPHSSLSLNTVTINSGAPVITGNVYGGVSTASGANVVTNQVLATSSTIQGSAYGGYSSTGTVYSNVIYFSGASSVGGNVAGGWSDSGLAYYNGAFISGNSGVTGSVFGGRSSSGAAYNNVVSIATTGTISGDVYGGYSDASIATYNQVSLSGGTVSGNLYGGYSSTSSATPNTVSISGGMVIGSVYGGYSGGAGLVDSSSVTLAGGTVGQNVYGGYSVSGSATSTSVTVTNALVNGSVFGAWTDGSGSVSSSSIAIYSGAITGSVSGGYSASGSSTSNSVSIAGGTTGNVYGGQTNSGSATSSTVAVYSGTITGDVAGGQASGNGSVTGNSVYLEGSDYTVSGNAYGGQANGSGSATGNFIEVMAGTTAPKNVYGGYSNSGIASNNAADIISLTSPMQGNVYGGYSASGSAANGNTTEIAGSTVQGDVYGGAALNGSANGNTIDIIDGTISGKIVGGEGLNSAINNTVTISTSSTSTNLTNADIYGGLLTGSSGDALTGNTLNVQTSVTARSVQNFQTYNFFIPASAKNGDTMLTATNAPVDVSKSTVNLTLANGSTILHAGNQVVLIHNVSGTPTNFAAAQVLQTSFLNYDFSLTESGGTDLLAVLDQATARPQAQSMISGHLAGLAFISQGNDLIVDQGLSAALCTTEQCDDAAWRVFFVGQGESLHYNTGSSFNVAGFNTMTGLAQRRPVGNGTLLTSVFFEGGSASDGIFSNSDLGSAIHGNGNAAYYGGGAMLHYTFDFGWYFDGSLRGGMTSLSFKSGDLVDSLGNTAAYDCSSAYYGLHVGTGYLWQISDVACIDFSTRYFWIREDGANVAVLGDPFSLSVVDSHRWRTGARLNRSLNELVTAYIGAYYDQEFGGYANGKVAGNDISAVTLQGASGVGELGLTVKSDDKNALLDFGVQGYLGVRQGVAGTVQLKVEF